MVATGLDTLPSELLSYICELIYNSHKPSLQSLTLVNRNCESAASAYLFRDLCFTYRCDLGRDTGPEYDAWDALLTRRNCLESVRDLRIHGSVSSLDAPLRFLESREALLEKSGWQEDSYDHFHIHEPEVVVWEDDRFTLLANLIQKLSHLEWLRWAVIEQIPSCVLEVIPKLRPDLRLEISEWRFRSPGQFNSSQDQVPIVSCAKLRSITARLVFDDVGKDLLLHMLDSLCPTLEEVRIIDCESFATYEREVSQETLQNRLQDVYARVEPKAKARLALFSYHGQMPVKALELERWLDVADTSALQRLELRSGIDSAGIWKSRLQAQSLPQLKELLLGFGFDCTSEMHDAVTEWMQTLRTTLQTLELHGNIPPKLVNMAFEVHGKTLRKLALQPEAHSGVFTLRFSSQDLKNINTLCPSLEQLAIPLERGRAIGSEFHEVYNYAALSQFANLTRLHLLLDCSRWGEMRPVWMLQGSGDDAYDDQTYMSLDVRRITFGQVRFALVNSAIDEILARKIWDLVAVQKIGLPLHEMYIQPYGNLEIITGFRPDDRPELARRLVDLYAMLREISRSYKLTRHIRDDVCELVAREPPGVKPRGYWSQVSGLERELGEVVCHPHGVEMEIFRRIWPGKPGSLSWRDEWYSLELPTPKREIVSGL